MLSTTNLSISENLRIDLHSHTLCSDGKLTPEELVERAVNRQIDVLAITDHDTVAALASAKRYITEQQYALKIIDGIEISTAWQGFEIHIVGLNINPEHSALTKFITEQQHYREQRAAQIAAKLAKVGFDDMLTKAKQLAGEGSITRAHFAQVLLAEGAVDKLQKAFDKYLGKGKKAYVKPLWPEISEAIDIIHQAGGQAVVAHPVRYDLSTKWLRRLLVEFSDAGGDGMEIVLPQMNLAQKQLMLSLCLQYNLQASLGSDFHFPSQWTDLGKNLVLPDNCTPIWQTWSAFSH